MIDKDKDREEEGLAESTREELDRGEESDEQRRLETLESVRKRLESELEERDQTPPA